MRTPTLLRTRTGLGIGLLLLAAYGGCDFQSSDSSSMAGLTLKIKGDYSGGVIVSNPAGIECGSSCASTFAIGTKVELTVTTEESSEFVGWEGACTGSASSCSVSLDAGKEVIAVFRSKSNRADLTISFGGKGGGSVTSQPVGLQCSSQCTGGFEKGTMVTLTAAPDATSVFSGWTGACSGAARTCMVTLADATQVTANFANPETCEQIRADAPTSTDGNRKLFIGGEKAKPFDAFCLMSAIPALTYLNLTKTAATENFSQYTAGGSSAGTNVKTNYTKIRFDPLTLRVDTNDKRYASSVGSLMHSGTVNVTSMPYATAMGCQTGMANGLANIDLTGTSFALATASLAVAGFMQVGATTPTPDGQARTFNLTGGGNCGWNAPTGANAPYNSQGSALNLVYLP